MLHIACGGQNRESRSFFDHVIERKVPFNVIGQSYYPRWHGTLEDLKGNLTDLATRYHTPIIVVEYSTPNVTEINDIVHNLPEDLGSGTFIWEPANGALFNTRGETKPEMDAYPNLAKKYARK